jgi:hypothetical protein
VQMLRVLGNYQQAELNLIWNHRLNKPDSVFPDPKPYDLKSR